MVAMAIAFGFQPTACRNLLELTGSLIFKKTQTLGTINSAKFKNYPLKKACDVIWKDKKLKDAKKKVVIPAFLMDNHNHTARSWEPRLFTNLSASEEENEELASDIVMRTTAAPTYFPSYQSYVDGGMFAHDPASW
jgi:patatin-like phospholipase/acyl hydrolase